MIAKGFFGPSEKKRMGLGMTRYFFNGESVNE